MDEYVAPVRSIRASWRSVLFAPAVLAVVAAAAVATDRSSAALALVTVLVIVAAVLAHMSLRRLELRTDVAVVRGVAVDKWIPRSEIVAVEPGAWWHGGVALRCEDRTTWAPIGDRLLGGARPDRIEEIRAWAFASD
jgi:hypothetical protein